MAVQHKTLSNRTVAAFKVERDTVFWDRDLGGVGLQVRRLGRRVNVVQTRVKGKFRQFTIGAYAVVSTEQARAQALEILALAKMGIDPRGCGGETRVRAERCRTGTAVSR